MKQIEMELPRVSGTLLEVEVHTFEEQGMSREQIEAVLERRHGLTNYYGDKEDD